MKKLIGTLVFGLLLMAGSFKAWAFEGEVVYKYTHSNGEVMTMDDFIKGTKIRANTTFKDTESSVIMDLAKRKMWVLMHKQKMVMSMGIPDSKKIESKVKGKFHKTGKTQVILGYKCEEWLYESDYGSSSIWTASGFGAFPGLGGKAGEGEEWIDAIKSKKLFALKIVNRNKEGKETGTMEATKIEKKSLPDSLFKVPSDYKIMNMPDMGKAMENSMGKSMEDAVKPKLPF